MQIKTLEEYAIKRIEELENQIKIYETYMGEINHQNAENISFAEKIMNCLAHGAWVPTGCAYISIAGVNYNFDGSLTEDDNYKEDEALPSAAVKAIIEEYCKYRQIDIDELLCEK